MPKFFATLFLIFFAAYSLAHAEPAPTNNIPASELPEIFLGYWHYVKEKSSYSAYFTIYQFDKKASTLNEVLNLADKKFKFDFESRAQISPDNKKILYASKGKIYLLDLKTLQKIVLSANGKQFDKNPVWLLQGRKIAYETLPNSNPIWSPDQTITIVDADGKNRKLVTLKNVDHVQGSFEWSPDGKKVAYTSSDDQRIPQVLVTNIDNNQQYQITRSPSYGFSPAWSPDSKKIAYISNGEEVYISDYDGKNQKKLTETYYDSPCSERNIKLNDLPRWSPNGNQLLFQTNRHCSPSLYTINTVDKELKRLTLPMSLNPQLQAQWFPQGRFAFYLYPGEYPGETQHRSKFVILDTQANRLKLF